MPREECPKPTPHNWEQAWPADLECQERMQGLHSLGWQFGFILFAQGSFQIILGTGERRFMIASECSFGKTTLNAVWVKKKKKSIKARMKAEGHWGGFYRRLEK